MNIIQKIKDLVVIDEMVNNKNIIRDRLYKYKGNYVAFQALPNNKTHAYNLTTKKSIDPNIPLTMLTPTHIYNKKEYAIVLDTTNDIIGTDNDNDMCWLHVIKNNELLNTKSTTVSISFSKIFVVDNMVYVILLYQDGPALSKTDLLIINTKNKNYSNNLNTLYGATLELYSGYLSDKKTITLAVMFYNSRKYNSLINKKEDNPYVIYISGINEYKITRLKKCDKELLNRIRVLAEEYQNKIEYLNF